MSATVLTIALSRAGVVWTGSHAALVLSTVVSGAVFFGALFVMTATVAFWWIDSGEFANGFTYGGRDFARMAPEAIVRCGRRPKEGSVVVVVAPHNT